MSPLEIYVLFVLPGLVIAAGGAFIVRGRRELERRAARAKLDAEAEVQRKSNVVIDLRPDAVLRLRGDRLAG